MNDIDIKDLITIINKYFPKSFYSIMSVDAYMPMAKMPNGSPAFAQIDLAIKNFSSGFTVDFNVLLMIVEQFNDVKDMLIVINNFNNKISPYSKDARKNYIDDSLVKLIIEDLDLVELTCKDKLLEGIIKNKLGEIPIRVTCNK